MGNHIFIIDSVAIGEYISGLIDKKFKSSSEFCNKWLEENNEHTDKVSVQTGETSCHR